MKQILMEHKQEVLPRLFSELDPKRSPSVPINKIEYATLGKNILFKNTQLYHT